MSEPTLREHLEAVEAADEVYSRAAEHARAAKSALEAAKTALQVVMTEQGTDIVRKEGITVTNVDKERPNVIDWEVFYDYVKRSGDLQLFERRVSAKAYDELLESRKGKELPGTQVFKYQQLQIRRG